MKNNTISIGGVILILLGITFFLENFIDIDINWNYVWPLIMIAVGVNMILNKKV